MPQIRFILSGLVLCLTISAGAIAESAELQLSWGSEKTTLAASKLLKRSDVETVRLHLDPAYAKPNKYRAAPLLALLADLNLDEFDILQIAATDGYVSQLPVALIRQGAKGGAIAWLAIEDPANPWPKLPKKEASAGPFYLIWQYPKRSNITPAQWPYSIASMTGEHSPQKRWPQMAVAKGNEQAERGMIIFVKHCIACHRIDGAGQANIGPDMARPMSPTEYMSPSGLRALIRDPRSVRSWPKQEMTGFAEDVLPDEPLEDLVGYLTYIASERSRKRQR